MNLNNCLNCEHYILQQSTVYVDVTADSVTATARYACEKCLAPDVECASHSQAIIEDSIVWKRGDVDEK